MTKAVEIVRKPSSSVTSYVAVEPKAWNDRMALILNAEDPQAICARMHTAAAPTESL